MALTAGIGDIVRVPFFVTDIDGVTPYPGLPNTSFTKTLVFEDTLSAVTMVVDEIGGGHYYAEFVPDANGTWAVFVITPVQDIYNDDVLVGEYDIREAVALIQKTAINRLEIDFASQELILYDDDGTSVKQRWDLETDAGPPPDPVTTHTGVQTKRKVPKL